MESWPASLALSLSCLVGEFEGVEGGGGGGWWSSHGDEANRVGQNKACRSQLAMPELGPEEYKNDWVWRNYLPWKNSTSLSHILGVLELYGVRLGIAV